MTKTQIFEPGVNWRLNETVGAMKPIPGTAWRIDWKDSERSFWRVYASHFWLRDDRQNGFVTFWATEGGKLIAAIPAEEILAIRRLSADGETLENS